MREYVRSRTVDCGEYVRVNNYPVRAVSKKRGAKKKPTSAAQEKLNAENAAHRLADLIHTNFTPDDLAVHLTYRKDYMPETVADAMRLVYNYMRRICRLWQKKTGGEKKDFRWIAVCEKSPTGRIHHHCVITGGLSIAEISDKWGMGHTSTKALEFDECGLVGWSRYITKSRISYRRWQASKNLQNPAVRENDYKIRKRDVKYIIDNPDDAWFIEQLHPGYKLTPGSVKIMGENEFGAGYFISYMLYRADNSNFEYDRWGRLHQKRKNTGRRDESGKRAGADKRDQSNTNRR